MQAEFQLQEDSDKTMHESRGFMYCTNIDAGGHLQMSVLLRAYWQIWPLLEYKLQDAGGPVFLMGLNTATELLRESLKETILPFFLC